LQGNLPGPGGFWSAAPLPATAICYGKDSRLAILTDGTRLPVSRAGYARLKSLLDERK